MLTLESLHAKKAPPISAPWLGSPEPDPFWRDAPPDSVEISEAAARRIVRDLDRGLPKHGKEVCVEVRIGDRVARFWLARNTRKGADRAWMLHAGSWR